MNLVERYPTVRRRLATAVVLLLLAAVFARSPRPALAFSASGPLLSNGAGTGVGSTTSVSGPGARVSIALQGAKASATYAVFACLSMVTGGFDCIGKNNPPAFSQVQVAPKAIAPVVVTLAQQGALTTDANGNGSTTVGLNAVLLPDTPASIYNVVQLINIADMNDSYTGLDLQVPVAPVAGVDQLFPFGVTLALGTPVYVFAQFPGYLFPVAITTINGFPFTPFVNVPFNLLGVFPFFPFTFFNGLCPSGLPPTAVPGPFGIISFIC